MHELKIHELWMMARSGLLHTAVASLLHYLSRSAVSLTMVGAAAWIGDRMLRRMEPQARHRMWVAALLTGVALPLLPAWLLANSFGHAGAGGASATVTTTYQAITTAAESWTLPPPLDAIGATAYLLTVLLSMTRLLWRWRRAFAMVRRADAVPSDAAMRGSLENAAWRFGVSMPEMRCSMETRGPVVLGLGRAVLLVPDGFIRPQNETDVRAQRDGDIAAALAHECAHLARRDFAKNLIYECVATVVAYHPASRLMRRRIAETRELVCDEMAGGALGDRPEYAASLLRLATGMASCAAEPSHAIGVFDANILEERIMRMTMDVPTVTKARKMAMAVVAAGALVGGAVTAMAVPFDVGAQTATQEKVYKIGGDVTPPVLISSVDAEFSKKAKDAKYQGVSVVALVVDAHGMPQHVHTVRKLGMGLDEKAVEAVRQYKFDPAMRNGKPVAVAIKIEVNFRIY